MNKTKIAYYVSTAILSIFMLFSAYMELTKSPGAPEVMIHLGYPIYLLYILGVAKILGVIGIWQNKVHFLREWAYAGFMIDVSGALASHLFVGDGVQMYGMSVATMIIILISYASFKKLNPASL